VGTGREDLQGGFAEAVMCGERRRSDAGEVVTFAKDRQHRIAKIVAEVSGEKTNEKFAEDGGLLDPPHQQTAESGTEGDEYGSNENGDDRIGVREARIGIETSD
jgi:hypothetical protein